MVPLRYSCYLLFALDVYIKLVNSQCPIIIGDEIGNFTAPSSIGLLSQARRLESRNHVNPKIQVLDYKIVCINVFDRRDTFRSVSLVVNYTESRSMDSTPQENTSQLDLRCNNKLNVWERYSNPSANRNRYGITTPPDANFSTPLREDCGSCTGSLYKNENHCLGITYTRVDLKGWPAYSYIWKLMHKFTRVPSACAVCRMTASHSATCMLAIILNFS